MEEQEQKTETKNPLKEIIDPFKNLIHAPRALWGINLAYTLEGLVYFGMLGYLAIYFSDFIFQGITDPDKWSHLMVGFLTAGITISMLFLGFIPDKIGVRRALFIAFSALLIGRIIISSAPTILGLKPQGLWSPLHLVTMVGILFIILGYGMYQPAAYAGVRKFTSPKTAAMGFAMLYALMNLGGWLPSFAFLLRDENYMGLGISGTYWVYTVITAVALISTLLILTKRTENNAITKANAERTISKEESKKQEIEQSPNGLLTGKKQVPLHLWGVFIIVILLIFFLVSAPWGLTISIILLSIPLIILLLPRQIQIKTIKFIARHPLADIKFFFFIFALIPVQTLFTYNWFVLPQYISRSYEGWIGRYFEIAANMNPLLIFILVPIITAFTLKAKVYKMMILGTTVMALPAFLLAFGTNPILLFSYILIMTIGEAMWQPRFLQYAAEIAPENRTGEYMGVAQLPWFLTKVLVPILYSGKMMDIYCPAEGIQNTEMMWFIYGLIAIVSPITLILAKKWMGKGLDKKRS